MSDAAFEKWISETSGFTNDDVLIAHAGWNAALASRATGEMPERPQRKRCDSSVMSHYYCSHTGTMAYCEAVEAQIAELSAQVEQKDAEIADAKEELRQLRDRLTAIRKVDPDWHEMQSTEADAIGEESLLPCVAHHDAQRDLLRLYIKGEAEIVAKGALATAEESGIRKALEAERYREGLQYILTLDNLYVGDSFQNEPAGSNGAHLVDIIRQMAEHAEAVLLPSAESASKEPK